MLGLRVANHGMLMRGAEQSEGQAIRCAVHFCRRKHIMHMCLFIHTHTQTHTHNSWSRSRYITNSRSTN